MAYILCYKLDYSIKGLLMGISTGTLLQCLMFLYLLFAKQDYMYSKVEGVLRRRTSDIRGESIYGDPELRVSKAARRRVLNSPDESSLLLGDSAIPIDL